MDKKLFLETLRQALTGEVSSDVVEDNIRYYDQYIGDRTREEEIKILNELGNPRLIAKTIIETNKSMKQKYNNYQKTKYSFEEEQEETPQSNQGGNSTSFFARLKWWQKLAMIFVVIIIFAVLIFLGRIIISVFLTLGVPILILLLFLSLFKNRN